MINSYKNNSISFFGIKLMMVVFCVVFCNMQSNAQGAFTALTSTAPHYNEGVMLVLPDGSVLCKTSSGGTSYGTKWDRLTPDAHGSYLNGTWTTIAAMANERLYFSTQVLNDGRVYVAGGEYGDGGDQGEVYNMLTNTWTACPQIVYSLSTKISDANSEIMANGKVLQAVVDTANCQLNFLWDPATNTYTQTASCVRRNNEAAWLKLPDGSVLFIDNYSTTSERYIQATNTWINDGTVPDELFDPYGYEQGGAFVLPDGRGFFIGSTSTTAYYTPSGSTAAGAWAAGPAIPASLGAPDAASCMMVNGNILLALAATPAAGDTFDNTTYYYEFNYLTNTFTETGAPGGGTSLPNPSFVSNMVALPDGTVLYANQGDDQYYEYAPGSGALAAGKPTLDSVLRINCDTFMATGLLFNGITEGGSYGDDWQMSTNYPIVRLTSGTDVYYARSYGWNHIGAVMTGSLIDTTMFVLPSGMPAGTYTVQVIANGNPSNSKTYNTSLTITPSSLSLCAGYTTTYTDIATVGAWSSANTGVATIDPASGLLTGVSGGTTTISYSIGACYATAPVTILTSPTVITPSGGLDLCLGSNITLHSTPATGTWSSTFPATASVGPATGIVTGSSAGVATISYTVGTCAVAEAVTVNALPTATITPSGSTSLCTGGSVVLNASAGSSYQWLSGGSAISGATNASYTASSAGNYAVTVTIAAGCSATSPVTVVTVGSSAAPITGVTTICLGATSTLSDGSGSGTWSSSNIAVASVGTGSGVVTGASDGTATITFTVGSGCTATTTVTVSSTTAPITGSTTVCTGSTATLSDGATGGTWLSSDPLVATVGATTGVVTGVSSGTATISYNVTGCIATAIVTIASATLPITGSMALCTGGTTTLADATTGGSWSSSNIAVATVGAASGVVTGITAGTAIITYSLGTDCVATATVTVNTGSVPAIAGASTVCAGQTISLTDGVAGGTWSSDAISIATVSASTGVVTAVAPGSVAISYTVGSSCGSAIVTKVITISAHVPNTITVLVTQSGIVAGSVDTFVAIAPDGGATPLYQWLLNGVAIPGATSSLYITSTLAEGDVISCRETSSDGCASPVIVVSSGVSVRVIPVGVQQFSSNGDNFRLVPNPNKGSFTIEGSLKDHSQNNVSIIITDMLGQTIYKQIAEVHSGSLNVPVTLDNRIADGMYLVTITSGDDHVVCHVVINR